MSSPVRSPIPETLPDTIDDPNIGVPVAGDDVDGERTWLEYMQLFWADRRLLLRAALFSFVISAVIAFLIPVRYKAVTRLMPPDTRGSSGFDLLAAMAGGRGGAGLSQIGADLLGLKNSGSLFVGILGSATVEDQLIEQFNLKKVYHDSHIEDTRKSLAEHTTVDEDRKSGIISISVTDHDAARATAMAQASVLELDRVVAQLSTSSARRERIFLESRLKAVKADLDAAAKELSEFSSQNMAIDIPAQAKAMVESAAVLQGQLIAAQSELSGLKQMYTSENIRVRAAEARVNELQRKIADIAGNGSKPKADSANLPYPSIRALPILGVKYADLLRETKIQETVYELLTQQYELAKVQEAKEIPSVKVLDPAIIPTKKSFPPRRIIVILGTIFAVIMAMAWIVTRSWWEALDENDPGKEFAIEVLTVMRGRLALLIPKRFSRAPQDAGPDSGRASTELQQDSST